MRTPTRMSASFAVLGTLRIGHADLREHFLSCSYFSLSYLLCWLPTPTSRCPSSTGFCPSHGSFFAAYMLLCALKGFAGVGGVLVSCWQPPKNFFFCRWKKGRRRRRKKKKQSGIHPRWDNQSLAREFLHAEGTNGHTFSLVFSFLSFLVFLSFLSFFFFLFFLFLFFFLFFSIFFSFFLFFLFSCSIILTFAVIFFWNLFWD